MIIILAIQFNLTDWVNYILRNERTVYSVYAAGECPDESDKEYTEDQRAASFGAATVVLGRDGFVQDLFKLRNSEGFRSMTKAVRLRKQSERKRRAVDRKKIAMARASAGAALIAAATPTAVDNANPATSSAVAAIAEAAAVAATSAANKDRPVKMCTPIGSSKSILSCKESQLAILAGFPLSVLGRHEGFADPVWFVKTDVKKGTIIKILYGKHIVRQSEIDALAPTHKTQIKLLDNSIEVIDLAYFDSQIMTHFLRSPANSCDLAVLAYPFADGIRAVCIVANNDMPRGGIITLPPIDATVTFYRTVEGDDSGPSAKRQLLQPNDQQAGTSTGGDTNQGPWKIAAGKYTQLISSHRSPSCPPSPTSGYRS